MPGRANGAGFALLDSWVAGGIDLAQSLCKGQATRVGFLGRTRESGITEPIPCLIRLYQ